MRSLERLLRPKSIAVLGGAAATKVILQSIKMGFEGDIWPVHPSKDEVEGIPAYRSLADLPGVPDAAFVGLNRNLTVEVVQELAAMGAGGAICHAAGFSETKAHDESGDDLQKRLVAAAGDMPIIGPNSYGLINYADGALMWPGTHGGARLNTGARGVAIVSQSGNIGFNATMQRRGLPIAYVISAGNQAQTGLSEIGLGLLEDDRVTALGLYVEAFDSVSGFEQLAERARVLRKPIVVLKGGRSEHAREAAVSHTASLAGSDTVSSSFLARIGMARVNDLSAFIETLKLLHTVGPLSGGRLSSMSWSGGEAIVISDVAEGRNVGFPRLEDAHRARLQSALGPLVPASNPLDYNNYISHDEVALTAVYTAMVSGGYDLNFLIIDFPRADRCSESAQWAGANLRAFQKALEEHGARGAIISSLPENLPEDRATELIAQGIAPLAGFVQVLEAAEAAAFIGAAWDRPRHDAVLGQVPAYVSQPLVTLSEADAKKRLREEGMPIPDGVVVANAAEAAESAKALGFPVVVKALGVNHKSDVGGVRLHLADESQVRSASQELSTLGTGLYVERMVRGAVGELIVGVTRDPVFGPVMTIGTGGVLVELLRDSSTLLLPTRRDEVEAAVRSLQHFPVLNGYRGKPKGDVDAAIDAIMAIASFAVEHAHTLEELDINPLIVCEQGKGAWAADALMVLRQNQQLDRAEVAASGGLETIP